MNKYVLACKGKEKPKQPPKDFKKIVPMALKKGK